MTATVLLLNCPLCGAGRFTVIGLSNHRCPGGRALSVQQHAAAVQAALSRCQWGEVKLSGSASHHETGTPASPAGAARREEYASLSEGKEGV
jgi:hypothetical protein